MARVRSGSRYTARRPGRDELPRVPAQHLRPSRFARHRAVWGLAAAMLVAGAGVFLFSTGLTTRSAGAAADNRAITPGPTPFVSISPPPVQTTAVRTTPTPSASAVPLADASALAADGIPSTALAAYQQAATWEHQADPACGLTWPLLAGIGRVESDHGRFGGAVLHTDGTSTPRIVGIPLDGHATALIRDTDKGRLDGDVVFDHAVGPMQFIPSTWALYGIDGNHDGHADPNNIFDAARTAAGYLCAAGGNLTTIAGQSQAVLTYNNSDVYLALVIKLEGIYAREVPGLVVPSLPAGAPTGHKRPNVPPADPGTALGATPSGPSPQPSGTGATSTTQATSTPASTPPDATPTGDPTPSTTALSTTPTATQSPTASPSPTCTSQSTPPPSPSPSPASTGNC